MIGPVMCALSHEKGGGVFIRLGFEEALLGKGNATANIIGQQLLAFGKHIRRFVLHDEVEPGEKLLETAPSETAFS